MVNVLKEVECFCLEMQCVQEKIEMCGDFFEDGIIVKCKMKKKKIRVVDVGVEIGVIEDGQEEFLVVKLKKKKKKKFVVEDEIKVNVEDGIFDDELLVFVVKVK